MKVCIYCDSIHEDEVKQCPDCNGSWFRKQRITNINAVNPDQLLEFAIQKARIKFTEKQKIEFKQIVISSCKQKNIPINSKNIDDFIQHLLKYGS